MFNESIDYLVLFEYFPTVQYWWVKTTHWDSHKPRFQCVFVAFKELLFHSVKHLSQLFTNNLKPKSTVIKNLWTGWAQSKPERPMMRLCWTCRRLVGAILINGPLSLLKALLTVNTITDNIWKYQILMLARC